MVWIFTKNAILLNCLKPLLKVEGIEWIRMHYAFPTGFPMDVLEVMKQEPKVCNYLDIPLQHITDSVLKSMRQGDDKAKNHTVIQRF